MANSQGSNWDQRRAKEEVDAFLHECEALLRDAVEEDWIAGKGPDFFSYLWERLKEASALGLEEKALILKYLTAAVVTDETDVQEAAGFAELKRDLETGEYDEAQLMDAYIESYLEEEDEESGFAEQHIGQNTITGEILRMLATALQASLKTPFQDALLDIRRVPGFVDFAGYYSDTDGTGFTIDDLQIGPEAFSAVHQLYAITIASGAEDWNRLRLTLRQDGAIETKFHWGA